MDDVAQALRAGTRLAQQGQYEEAAETFLEVMAEAEEDPRGWFGAGVCFARAGKLSEGREALQEALRLGHPKAKETLEKLAAWEAKKARTADAQASPAAIKEPSPKAPPAPAPVAQEPAPGAAGPSTITKINLGKRVRIMLIEDKGPDRQAITEALDEGIENVEIVHSPFAETASRTIVAMGIFDVAIMDWNTSPGDAKELLDFLKLKQPHVPVIVLTSAWSEEMATDAIRAGADYCMVKASGYARILPSVIEQRFKQSFALQEKLLSEMDAPAQGWRKYFEALDHPALLLGQDGKVLDVNLAAVALLHEARDRLAGRRCEELFRAAPGDEAFFPLSEAFAAGELVSVERDEPNMEKRFRVSVYPVADEDEAQYVCELEDISTQSAGGLAPGARLGQALDQVDEQIFFVDDAMRFLYANAPFAASLGLSAEELIGRTEGEVRPGPEAERHEADLRLVLDRDEPRTTEEQRDGRWYAYRLVPVRVEDKIVGVAGLGRDLSDLRGQEARGGADVLGRMADLADDMAFELEPDGTVTFVNSAAEGVCGRRSSEVVGRPFEDMVDPDARDGWREMLQRVIATGQSIGREEVPLRRPDGTVFYGELNLTASVEPSTGEVTGARGMLRDISARKRLERALGVLKGDVPLA